jgi:hypothetical protein
MTTKPHRSVKTPPPPALALKELFLAVADFVDGDQDGEVPSYLSEAYLDVFHTDWGQEVYCKAVEESNKKL